MGHSSVTMLATQELKSSVMLALGVTIAAAHVDNCVAGGKWRLLSKTRGTIPSKAGSGFSARWHVISKEPYKLPKFDGTSALVIDSQTCASSAPGWQRQRRYTWAQQVRFWVPG
jgi:hypothetical protein